MPQDALRRFLIPRGDFVTFPELKEKALTLPYAPGVYIMRDKTNTVIYVGKAKKLKNRVSQYFQETASHSPKTRIMVSKIDHFDVIVAASEFEALVLECSLIKRYLPKYNILLKDDKGYPYLRLNMNEIYPRITLVNKIADDGAQYFGPYGSRSVTQDVLEAIRLTLKLPGCSKQFPRDVGKERPTSPQPEAAGTPSPSGMAGSVSRRPTARTTIAWTGACAAAAPRSCACPTSSSSGLWASRRWMPWPDKKSNYF